MAVFFFYYPLLLQGWEVLLFGRHTLTHSVVMVHRCGMSRILTYVHKDQLPFLAFVLPSPASLLFTLK